MKVLVTGSSGFIGQHVRAALTARGHEPVRYDTSAGQSITKSPQLLKAMAGAEAVINLAGVLGTPELFGSEAAAIEVNVMGAVNVFTAAARYHLPVVQIATGHRGQPNPYAITKAAAEDIALARAQWQGQKIAIVRAYHVYGPGQKPCAPHGPASVRKIIPSFACRALTGMLVEVNGSGEQLIDLVYVEDVAEVLVEAIGGPYGEVIEAGTGKAITVTQAARDVVVACGSDSRIVMMPPRTGEPPGAVVVATTPACPNPWPHNLEETVAWYRAWVRQRGAADIS